MPTSDIPLPREAGSRAEEQESHSFAVRGNKPDVQRARGSAAESASFLIPLPVPSLYRAADLSGLTFRSTDDLEPTGELIGQSRAVDAISLATAMDAPGFNLFVAGPASAEIRHAVRSILSRAAGTRLPPPDWVYVYNFSDPHMPIAIALPSGRARALKDAMHALIADLKLALPAAFEREQYQTRRGDIDETARKKQAALFEALGEKARAQDIVIVRTPAGFAFAPERDGKIVEPDIFNTWSEEERRGVQEKIADLEQELEHALRQIPGIEKERRERLRALNRETASLAVGNLIEEIRVKFSDLPKVVAHLDRVRENLVESVPMFFLKSEAEEEAPEEGQTLFERYEVNILISRDADELGAPIIEEAHPTLINLIGRSEYVARHGVLMTSFRLIKAGALHRANGGYLILDARSLLSEPFSWPAIKRALRSHEIAIEEIGRFMGLAGTVTLEPDPIPLKVRVILIGERLVYYLLSELDPEFREHFKLLADFDDDIDRSAENEGLLARTIADMLRRDGLKPMDRAAVALMIEHSSRIAADAKKLAVVADEIRDVLIEADHWAAVRGRDVLLRDDVQKALDEKETRAARLRERAQDAILRDIAQIETAGAAIGQVNGLSVIELGGFGFGRPSRITARVRPGAGKVTDIEREVALGGPLHSKGVLILSGFLAGRYALQAPMSLSASLVFEQSYGGVEGDSASLAELCALLSALADFPFRQDFAVTGSINQHGNVQAIGGVNEKIEGFFDICKARRLSGTQGVIIPRSNVQHLMLRSDVIEACARGEFAVYAVSTVDEAMELLAGRPAGARDPSGHFPEGSVNGAVDGRLNAFAAIRRTFAMADTEGKTPEPAEARAALCR